MNRQIAKLGAGLLVCYLALFVQLNYATVFGSGRFDDNASFQARELRQEYGAIRGTISTADGTVVARSVRNPTGSDYDYSREYPEGELFAHTVGYFTLEHGTAGVETTYEDELTGDTLDLTFQGIDDLFVDRERVGDLTLTLRSDAQAAARDTLGEREGSVVAIDPRSGEILALWSWPTFDPNAVASQDFAAADATFDALLADEENPLRARAYRDIFFPGSTFKPITASAGIERGEVTETEPVYPVSNGYTPPQTSRPLRNFGGSSCGGDLFEILRVSCNTAFAEMAIETGPDAMIATAEAYGFNNTPPIDLPNAVASVYPTDFDQNLPALAQTGIGQNDVSATPLQMALMAAAIANDGEIMAPRVVGEVRDDEGRVIDSPGTSVWRRAIDPDTAAVLREAMVGVVEGGTATNLAISGFAVGGKTGTAQLGTDPPRSHAWIVGFAGPEGEEPTVAVAVIVEGQEGASEQTGGRVAAPIARAVLQTVLAAQHGG